MTDENKVKRANYSGHVANAKSRKIHTVCYGSRYLHLRKVKHAPFSQRKEIGIQMQDILAVHKITMHLCSWL